MNEDKRYRIKCGIMALFSLLGLVFTSVIFFKASKIGLMFEEKTNNIIYFASISCGIIAFVFYKIYENKRVNKE